MATNLVIVESPAKCRTIQKYLGATWRVEASFGHIRDLPPKDMGIDLTSFKPDYQVSEGSVKTIRKLKLAASQASMVWLASDPDREGEAIAWHLEQALGLKKYQRITFNEITQKAVRAAVNSPRRIDMAKVDSQQGRRILDRLIGWLVSPVLSDMTGMRMAAGRVQSPAVRLIKEREDLIKQFEKVNHFGVELDFDGDGLQWQAKWDSRPFISDKELPWITDRQLAESVAEILSVKVISNTKKKRNKAAPAPFITISLQQSASNYLKFSPKKTMQLAQKLYESGLITYMRTDNPNFSDEAFHLLKNFMASLGKSDLMRAVKNTWKGSGDAQEAHEAIRCTDFSLKVPDGLKQDELRLYKLIRSRAIACQMKPATYEDHMIVLEGDRKPPSFDKKPIFSARSSDVLFPGWLSVTKEYEIEKSDEDNKNIHLPNYPAGTALIACSSRVKSLETKPPSAFTEASLAKELEKRGIGRPSTFASIIDTIQRHEFVEIEKRFFHMKPKGNKLIEVMRDQLKLTFVEYQYTRNVERELDKVASREQACAGLMKGFYEGLQQELSKALPMSASLYQCPDCSSPLRNIKMKKGSESFWGCSAYSAGCKRTFPDENGKPYIPPVKPQYFCTETGSALHRKKSKRAWFWVNVEATKYYDDVAGKPVEQSAAKPGDVYTSNKNKKAIKSTGKRSKTGSPCPLCEGVLQQRLTGRRAFSACSNYPQCKHTEKLKKC